MDKEEELSQCQKVVVQTDKHNNDQCLRCVEIQCQNQIIKFEEIINEYQKTASSSNLKEDKENILNAIQTTKQQKIKLTNYLYEINNHHSKQRFRMIKEYSQKQYFSFVFNQDSTQLFAAAVFNKISVLKVNNGEIQNELQTLAKHTANISCLIFMNISNLLVSGSRDKSMIIWNQDQDSNWKLFQSLEGHQDQVKIMINNENENLLISGSSDQTIKFWKKVNMMWICFQTIEAKFEVLSLSLNKQQAKLISCGINGSGEILVIEQKQELQQWDVIQVIQGNCDGYQLCFITNSIFIFQGEQESLEIYQYFEDQTQFINIKYINVQKVQWRYTISYPCKYLQTKEILITQNGNYLNCYGVDEKQNYILLQPIEFYNDWVFWNVSNDGQFLVTVDFNYIMQVRRLESLK